MLESYFFQKNLGHLITKSKTLTALQRKHIVNVIADFILDVFGSPSYTQKLITAQAAIVAFPGLEYVGGEGTVSVDLLNILNGM